MGTRVQEFVDKLGIPRLFGGGMGPKKKVYCGENKRGLATWGPGGAIHFGGTRGRGGKI